MTEPTEPNNEPTPAESAPTAPTETEIDVSPFESPKFEKIELTLPGEVDLET